MLAATAENYSFPTNLDSDPPIAGNAPTTTFQIVEQALQSGLSLPQLQAQLHQSVVRQRA